VDTVSLHKFLEKEIRLADKAIIIDGHYSHELLNEKKVTLVILLRKAPWELREILQKRNYSNKKILENLEAEIMGVIAEEARERYPLEKIHEVDTTGKSIDDLVQEIIMVINGEIPSNPQLIDWLIYPETMSVLMNK
jgi:adenylate kinase